jgi:hypothetical protein
LLFIREIYHREKIYVKRNFREISGFEMQQACSVMLLNGKGRMLNKDISAQVSRRKVF